MGSGKRPALSQVLDTPGPGKYERKSRIQDGPKVSYQNPISSFHFALILLNTLILIILLL
jgi:hypothetical protein